MKALTATCAMLAPVQNVLLLTILAAEEVRQRSVPDGPPDIARCTTVLTAMQ